MFKIEYIIFYLVPERLIYTLKTIIQIILPDGSFGLKSIRENQNYFVPFRKKLCISRLIKIDQKSIRINPRHQSEWIQIKFYSN